MKRQLTTILLAVLVCGNTFATGKTDNDNPGGWDFDLPGMKIKKKSGSVEYSLGASFAFGFIGGVGQKSGVSIDMGQSYEMEFGDVLNAETRLGKKQFLSIGLGMTWRNYRVTGFKQFQKDERGIISMQDYPEDAEPKFSRIHTFSLMVPVKYYHYLSKKVVFGIGPELYFTPYGSLKTRWWEDGEKRKLTSGSVHQNRFSVGVGAELLIHHLGIYYKYDPFPVFRSGYGPRFSSMTCGLKVGF